MIEFLVGCAFYLTFMSSHGSIGTVMQMAALALTAGAALYALIMRRVEPAPLSVAEIVMYLLGINYVIMGVFGEENVVFLSMAFLTTVIAISIVCRATPLESLLDTCGRVALAGIVTIIAVDHQGAATALASGLHGGGKVGIVRFMPLGLHPDLTGYVFGACAWLMARRAILASFVLERIAMAGGMLTACTFVLAASSRSSLIALAVSTSVAVFIEYGFVRLFTLRWVRVASVLAVIVGLALASKIAAFITTMLELDSSVRGVSSGGSGRTELWARGIAAFFQDPVIFLFGGGFRSSSPEFIGFFTESSYISILLDSGALLGVAVIFLFWYAPVKALKIVPRGERHSSRLILVASLMTFVIVESVFNRYLLAIGNPASLMTLVILLALSLKPNAAVVARAVPRAWTPAQPTST